MEPPVSPLPLPLWPLLALSLTLFAVTAAAVTVSGHYGQQIYSDANRTQTEVAAPALAAIRNANARQMF